MKLTSDIVFLIASHSSFSCNKILTHSSVNLTWRCGFWFIFISDISFLFNVFSAYVAACRAGKASLRILSAYFFYCKAFSVFSAMIFSSSSTTTFFSPASCRSTSSFLRSYSCSIVFFSRIGCNSVNFTLSYSIKSLVYSSLWTPFESFPIVESILFLCEVKKWLKLFKSSM